MQGSLDSSFDSSLDSSHDGSIDSLTAVSGGVEALEEHRPLGRRLTRSPPPRPRSRGNPSQRASAASYREPLDVMQTLGEMLDPVDRAMTRFGRKLVDIGDIVLGPGMVLIEPLDAGLQWASASARRTFGRVDRVLGRAVGAVPLPRIVRKWLWLGDQPGRPTGDPVQAQWRNGYLSLLWLSVIVSVFFHAALFRFAPTMRAADVSVVAEELTSIELPPEIEIPPPPQSIARPAAPVIAATDLAEDVTIAPTTFDANPVGDLPPPPEVESTTDDQGGPAFTPFTVAPRMLNTDEVAEAMRREYPPLLRQAGIGGEVVVWVHITAAGVVEDSRVFQSSGQPELDEAALRVARSVEFSPAMNRDRRVPVWIQFPLTFRVR